MACYVFMYVCVILWRHCCEDTHFLEVILFCKKTYFAKGTMFILVSCESWALVMAQVS